MVMTEQEAKWAVTVITKKLRCGVSEETVEKLWPGMVPRFDVPPLQYILVSISLQGPNRGKED